MLTIRHAVRVSLVLGTLTLSPTLAYECVQKSSELFQPRIQTRHSIVRLSVRAEAETRWRPSTGFYLVDHALHEWQETKRFYTLAQRRRNEPSYR